MKPHSAHLSRRSFLSTTAAVTTGLLLAHPAPAEAETVRKVHVIFKTHLDIGFTDLAAKVITRYHDDFLPTAIRLARETRERHGPQCFKWTTGAWLLYTYLEHGDPAGRNALEAAIAAGDIGWHALPFTTHSEILDPSLFEAGMQLSQRLDERFGRNTIAGKMTDVPGHTRGIVPLLQANGVQLLHIGVNPASMPPDVPPVFLWQAPDNSRVAVMYQSDYGGVITIPGNDTAVAIVFTGDNHGPQTQEEVAAAYARLQKQYPDAELVASDLNEVAEAVTAQAEHLPVVTGELGDSWIHGVASDPLKIGQLRELSRLRRVWLSNNQLERHSGADLALAIPLCMVGEHTWGLDVKTHLQAWDVYTPDALQAARELPPFQRIEASWQEKRAYIEEAVNSLPPALQAEAKNALEQLRPTKPTFDGYSRTPDRTFESPHFSFALDPATGALTQLTNRTTGHEWAEPGNPLALFAYETFSAADYDRFLDQYLTGRPNWALADFGKPGLDALSGESRTWLPRLRAVWTKEVADALHLLAEQEMLDEQGAPLLGCPTMLTTEYVLPKDRAEVQITLQWFGKRANRLPEACWFSFVPRTESGGRWTLDKMEQPVDPADVVHNGGHKLHGVQKGIHYASANNALHIDSLDAPLVAPGQRTLLHFDNAKPKVEDGMHFCLCNNVWGTNFVMWFDDDMRFRFTLT
jgi:hypothetical protein